jgi:hypothetical protein
VAPCCALAGWDSDSDSDSDTRGLSYRLAGEEEEEEEEEEGRKHTRICGIVDEFLPAGPPLLDASSYF